MVNLYFAIKDLLDAHKNKVLLIAESSLLQSQFRAFRKLYLNETGESGLEKKLKDLLEQKHGTDRNGRE